MRIFSKILRQLIRYLNGMINIYKNKKRGIKFVASMTESPGRVKRIRQLWDDSGDPRDPFASVLITPLFASKNTLKIIRNWKEERGTEVYFDSGGFWVQQGKISYRDLYPALMEFYKKNQWADHYILPDNVPVSTDSPETVEKKTFETAHFSCMFFHEMPDNLKPKAIPVIQGHTYSQIYRAVSSYINLGIKYFGFGSFSTSGNNQNINQYDSNAETRLNLINEFTREYGIKIHVFGVGTPPVIWRLSLNNFFSFDSLGWMRAAGYGNIFMPLMPGKLCTHNNIFRPHISIDDFERIKRITNHKCEFCSNYNRLSKSRINRVMHNLSCILDTIDHIRKLSLEEIKKVMKITSSKYLYQEGQK